MTLHNTTDSTAEQYTNLGSPCQPRYNTTH
jgi:hypothetical protein